MSEQPIVQHLIHHCQEARFNIGGAVGLCGALTVPNEAGAPREHCPECEAFLGSFVTCPTCGESGFLPW